jgi:hypothetical protein
MKPQTTNVVKERLGVEGHPQHQRAQEGLHGDDPRLAAPDGGVEAGVDDGRPEELERVRITAQRKYGDLRIRKALPQEKRERV